MDHCDDKNIMIKMDNDDETQILYRKMKRLTRKNKYEIRYELDERGGGWGWNKERKVLSRVYEH